MLSMLHHIICLLLLDDEDIHATIIMPIMLLLSYDYITDSHMVNSAC